MKRAAKIFGIGSLILFAVSLTEAGSEVLWGGLKPISAILFIAAFICYLLGGEYERFDAEERSRLEAARRTGQPDSRAKAKQDQRPRSQKFATA